MVIDMILDRKDAENTALELDRYDPRRFYMECMEYGGIADDITRAMDAGDNADVVKALCDYIDKQEYNPDIKNYIRSKNWLEATEGIVERFTGNNVIARMEAGTSHAGKYYNVYGYQGKWYSGIAGYFDTLEEAEKMLMKHRPQSKKLM